MNIRELMNIAMNKVSGPFGLSDRVYRDNEIYCVVQTNNVDRTARIAKDINNKNDSVVASFDELSLVDDTNGAGPYYYRVTNGVGGDFAVVNLARYLIRLGHDLNEWNIRLRDSEVENDLISATYIAEKIEEEKK